MSYPRIDGKKMAAGEFKHTWNADLVYFDGPLVSLYKAEDGSDLLYVWLDCTGKSNRWCMFPVTRANLWNYLEKEKSLREVFEASKWVVVFQTGSSLKRSGLIKTTWSDLPENYLPDNDSYLDDDVATKAAGKLAAEIAEEYLLGLDGELFIEDLTEIPKVYQQLYSFHYGLEHIERPAVRNSITRLTQRWSGGFNAVHLFSGLQDVTPSIHRAKVCELRFNSPGFIRLELLGNLARQVEIAANRVADEDYFSQLQDFYTSTYRYFNDHELSGFDNESGVESRPLTPEAEKELRGKVVLFFRLLGWGEKHECLDALGINPLQQLRVLLAYYRRLRKLRPYLVSGNLILGRSPLVNGS
ncbi:hypothetical protein ACFOJE_01735 [Azotobacter bryophylli]|uniref:Uncharacterized protein n=1 Tax=Azotobacter bryophylli TaxID=1986537 RepID=A0ABV7ANB5_9GAMM